MEQSVSAVCRHLTGRRRQEQRKKPAPAVPGGAGAWAKTRKNARKGGRERKISGEMRAAAELAWRPA
jgi:hypothetical protein